MVGSPARTAATRLPGLEGIWAFIATDAAVFLLLFGSFLYARHADPALFEASRRTLDATLAGLDTLILLTGSWLVALGVRALADDRPDQAPALLLGGTASGVLFVVSKAVE